MPVPVDATHWPDPLARSYAHLGLRKMLLAEGFQCVGVAFYPGANADLTDDEIIYSGADGQEYARRIREGHATEVFVAPDGSATAEIDTRYGADQIWLTTLFDNGNVLWSSTAPSRSPKTLRYEPDPDDMQNLDPATRARLETAMGCFNPEVLVGDVDAAMHLPHPLVGFDIQVLPTLDLKALMAAHATRTAQTRGTPVPGSLNVLIAATERAIAVQQARERFAVGSGGFVVLAAIAVLSVAIWTLFDGFFFWAAVFIFGPMAVILGMTGFFMWPTRGGLPLSTWVFLWPPRANAEKALRRVSERPPAPAP